MRKEQGVQAPKVSVVVPVYNAEAFIVETIGSIREADAFPYEIVAVDDGSTDRSLIVLGELAAKLPMLRVLRHKDGDNLGVSRTRQLGVTEARGEYIAFLDADDCFRPGKLERQVQILDSNPQLVLVHTGVEGIDESGHLIEHSTAAWFNKAIPGEHGYSLLEQVYVLKSNHICNSSVLARSEFLRRLPLGMPQLFQYEDWLLWLLMAEKGRFRFIPDKLTRYRIHDSAFTASIRKNSLVRHYAHIELMLATAARAESESLRIAALQSINSDLSELAVLYERSDKKSDDGKDNVSVDTRVVSDRDMASYRLVKLERRFRARLARCFRPKIDADEAVSNPEARR